MNSSWHKMLGRDPSGLLMKFLIAFNCLIIAVAFTGCGGTTEPTDTVTLAKCYATEFGIRPPAGVKNIKAKQVVVGDAGGAWLRFEANSNIITQILSNHFVPSDHTTFISNSDGGNTPSWWKPEEDALTVFYINNQWTKGSNYSVAVLGYDNAHNVVYFHHGISF
jgi:hypothetical protein